MTEENSVIETFNSKKEDGGGSPKGLIIAIILLLVGGVGLGAYFFNFVEKKTTYKTPIVNNKDDNLGLESSNQMIITTRKEDFNYKGNFEFNLDIPTDESKLNLKIEDFQTISIDKGLQSRISLGNFLLNVEKKYGDNKIELKNLDIITDEEKTYLKVEGEDVKSLVIRELKYSNPKLIETINNIFSNEYVEIDNAKKLINIIDSNDELIISFVKGMMSPNAGQYFKKYGITDKLNKKFFSKDSYKLFLEETLREDNKIYVKIKDESCVLAINLVNKIAEDMGETNNMDVDSCMEKLEQINNTLANNLYITQDGNKETINYSGLIQFEMTYENGEILFVNILAPTINIKYEEKHLSINFSLIVPGVNTSLKIEQDFKNKYKGSIYASFLGGEQKFLFETNYQNNILTNREIEGNIGDSSGLLKFVGSGDNKKGSFSYQFIEKEKIISKGNYSYDNGRHLLSIISPDITIKGNMVNTNNNSEFILNIKEGENTTINTKGKLNYSDNKINLLLFILNYKSTEGTLNSKIDYKDNNLDINIIVNDKIKDEKTSLTAKGKLSKDEKNIVILGKINDIVDLEGTIVGDKNSCKIEFIEHEVEGEMIINLDKKIEGDKNIKTGNLQITEKGKTTMSADWNFDYSSGGVKYIIPSKAKKIDIPLFQKIQIPAFAGIFIAVEDK